MSETTLSALVALQLIMIGVFAGFDHLSQRPAPPFYSVEVPAIETVRLMEDDKEVVLKRARSAEGSDADADALWVLEDGLSADSGKVNQLLDQLAQAGEADWPVATTLISNERFEVGDASHKKRLVLERKDGEAALDLYLGTAPSFGQTHARTAGGLGIYAIRFAEHEASSDEKDWLNKTLLYAKSSLSLVQRLEEGVASWTLRQDRNGWHSEEVEGLQAEAAAKLTGRLKNLRVLDKAVAGIKVGEDALALHYRLSDADGSYELLFFDQGEESLVVKSSRMEQYFNVAYYLNDVLDVSVAELSAP